LLIQSLSPSQEIINGFSSSLVAGPVERRLAFQVQAIDIDPVQVKESQRKSSVSLGSDMDRL
jgi:hypothetical protein